MKYHFDDFELDEDRFELRREGKPVVVQRQVFEAIAYLVQHRDRVVSKDDLVGGPWRGAVVSDATLNHTIMLARRALSDAAARPRMIRTLRGKGFRFIAEVSISRQSGDSNWRHLEATDRRPFVGRQEELRQLRSAVDNALAGRGDLVLIGGEPGIGKTTLLEEFARTTSQAQVLWGRCWEAGGAPGFWPWLEVVRAYVARHGVVLANEMMGGDAAEIADHVPELRARLAGTKRQSPSDLADSPQGRFRMFLAVSQFLKRASARDPLVVVIDDLQAADEASVRLLEFLSRGIEGSSLLVVATYRDLDVTSPVLASIRGGPLGNSRRLSLPGLSEDEIISLIASTARGKVEASLARRVLDITGGNPFLVHELTTGTSPQLDAESISTFRIPDRVAAIIRQHLHHLPPSTMQLLRIASVIGQEFPLSLLAELSTETNERVLQRFEPAFTEAVLISSATAGATYRFSHALTREAIYRDMPLAERVALHFEIASRLAEKPSDTLVPQIAYHYLAAVPGKGASAALTWAIAAADREILLFAYESAAKHYQNALQMLDSVEEGGTKACGILLRLAWAEHLAGRQGEAIATYEQAENRARDEQLHDLVAEALLGAVEVMREGIFVQVTFPIRLRRALELLSENHHALRARLMAALAYATVLSSPAVERLALCDQAIAMARDLGDPTTLVSVLRASHWTITQSSQEKSLEVAGEIIDVAREARQPEKVLDAHMWRVGHLLGLGRSTEFQAEMQIHAAMTSRIKHPWHSWWAVILRGSRAAMLGELAAAEQAAREALAIGTGVQGPTAVIFFMTQMLTIGLERSDDEKRLNLEEIYPLVSKAVDQVPQLRVWLASPMALIDCELGRTAEARLSFEQMADTGFASLPDDQILIATLASWTRVAQSLGDNARTRLLYDRFRPHEGNHVTVSSAAAYWGPVSYYLGLLAGIFGGTDLAVSHLHQAIREAQRMAAPVHLAWAQVELGTLLRSGAASGPDRKSKGSDYIRAALSTAQRLGLPRLEARAREALKLGDAAWAN